MNRKSAIAQVTGFCPYALDRPSTVSNHTRDSCGYSNHIAGLADGMLNVLPVTSSSPGRVAATPMHVRAE